LVYVKILQYLDSRRSMKVRLWAYNGQEIEKVRSADENYHLSSQPAKQ